MLSFSLAGVVLGCFQLGFLYKRKISGATNTSDASYMCRFTSLVSIVSSGSTVIQVFWRYDSWRHGLVVSFVAAVVVFICFKQQFMI